MKVSELEYLALPLVGLWNPRDCRATESGGSDHKGSIVQYTAEQRPGHPNLLDVFNWNDSNSLIEATTNSKVAN